MFYLEDLYLAIGTHLMSTESTDYLDSLGLPPIKHIDLFNNQYNREFEEIAYNLPAIFVELAQADNSKRGRLQESNLETVLIHNEQKQQGSTAFNSHNRPDSLKILRMIDAIHILLKGFSGEFFGKFRAISRTLDTESGNNPVHILGYTSQVVKDSTDKYRDFTSNIPGEEALKVNDKKLNHKL